MAKVTDTTVNRTAPRWAGDFIGAHSLMPAGGQVDPAQFDFEGQVKVILTGNAAQAATSIAVTALSGAIPVGTVLRFSADEFVTVAAAAAAGATSIAVEALVNALETSDTAIYPGTTGRKYIPSGTPVGRTFAERDSGTPFGAAADTDDEFYLVAFDVPNALEKTDVELYRPPHIVKENYLPNWANLSSGIKAKIRSVYETQKGVN